MPPKTSGRIPGPIGTRSWIQWLLQWHEYRFTIWRNSPHGTRNLLTRWVWFSTSNAMPSMTDRASASHFHEGCPLSCIWCHNPEGIRNGKDKLYTAKKCLGCGTCLKACPNGALTLAPEGIITDKQNACYADAVPKNVRQWLSRYQERNIPPNTWCMK